MQIQEYKTAAEDTLKELDLTVNRLIKEGFHPFGSPYYVGKTAGNLDGPICQAMIRTGLSDSKKEPFAIQ